MSAKSTEPTPDPRILFVSFNFAPKLGGLEQVVREVWLALQERGSVLALVQASPDESRREGGVERARGSGLAGFMLFLMTTGVRRCLEQRFDVVVAGSALVALPTLLLARLARARAAVIIYGLDTVHDSRLYQWLYKVSVSRFDRVVAISHATSEEAVARGVARERIRIVFPGCHATLFAESRGDAALRARLGLGQAHVILSAGRLVERKGMDRFVRECLPEIVRRVPETRLLLAGGNPVGAMAHREDMAARVTRAVREVGLEDHVVMTGRLEQEEMIGVFQLADVFVLPVVPSPADMEGFGIVLLEAAAAGLPAVATRIGGIPDAVADGETGVLVAPLDYAAMADALVRFLDDAEYRDAFGRRGRKRVMRDFQWSQVAPRYADALLS